MNDTAPLLEQCHISLGWLTLATIALGSAKLYVLLRPGWRNYQITSAAGWFLMGLAWPRPVGGCLMLYAALNLAIGLRIRAAMRPDERPANDAPPTP